MKDYLMTPHTTRTRLGAIIMAISLVMSACSGGGAKATEVKITAPTADAAITVGQGTVIQGEANGDNITRVEVVVDGKAYASLSTPDKTKGVANFPVNLPWTPMAAGTHAIQLRAYGTNDALLGQSEPLVLDAKATVAQVTPTAATTKATDAGPVVTSTPGVQAAVTPTPTTSASSSNSPSLTVTNDFVNVRKGPAIGYDLLGTLDKGQTAPVRGKSSDGNWWQISYAAGTNGVGWVFGEYVQANAAANNVAVASAPALPTSAPQPTTAVRVIPIATAIPPTAAPAVQSQPLVGSLGQLHLNQNPIPQYGSVTAYWNVSNIQGIWFDKGDGSGFQAASGSQSVTVDNVSSQRTFQLKWRDSNGTETTDTITVYLSGVTAYSTATSVSRTCNSSDPNWRGGSSNYPFCVAQDLEWTNSSSNPLYVSYNVDYTVGVKWDVYGIAGLWLKVEGNGDKCGPAGSSGMTVGLNGSGTYYWNLNTWAAGGYIVHLYVLRNDGTYVYHNEKYLCIGFDGSGPTSTPAPATSTSSASATPNPTATTAPIATLAP
jgi:uncharacterized protein YraI